MNKIAIFYHGLFALGDPPEILPNAAAIIWQQMEFIKVSGLLEAASEMHIGINGSIESEVFSKALLPEKSKITYHGLDSRNENLTLVMIEQWLKQNAGEAYVLYFHAKGCTHPINDGLRTPWRNCMTRHVIHNWRLCVAALNAGYDAAGCHWMTPPATPPGQFIFGGNFWWAKASFLRTLPSIYERARIKESGIKAFESRYESEVWIGNGPQPPRVKDFHPGWNPGLISTCSP